MNIQQGYIQTELGIIPEDWKIKKIGECLSIGHGRDFKSVACGDIPVYGTGGVISYVGDYLYDGETVCLGRKGTINKPIWYEGKIWTVDTLFYTHSFKNTIPKFLYYLFSNIDWLAYNEATGVPSLTSYRIESIPIVNPPIDEQHAIAKALSDIDRLITALDRKIAKKRLIKQGAMQQTLTGKKCLPGFTGEWKHLSLGDILSYEQPTKYLVGTTDYVDAGIPVLTAGKTFILGYTTERTGVYDNLPVIIFDDFTTDSKYVTMPFKAKSSAMKMLQLRDNRYNLRLIYELMQMINFPLYDHQRYWISEYSKLQIYIPTDFEEQYAIANLLSNMDKEIADLEARRDKYKQVKNGMMQKLLTGEIRLMEKQPRVVSLEAHVVAGHVVYKLHESIGWGRTKLQKALHLINYHCQIGFGAEFIRNTAGPDDQHMLNCIDAKFRQYRHVDIQQEKCNGRTHYTYKPTAMIQEVESVYNNYPQEIRESIDNLLQVLDEMDLGGAEIVSTLYAVWNNRIIKQQAITDDLLLGDFYAWSEHKADFGEVQVRKTLNYMKTINLVPTGWGRYIDNKKG